MVAASKLCHWSHEISRQEFQAQTLRKNAELNFLRVEEAYARKVDEQQWDGDKRKDAVLDSLKRLDQVGYKRSGKQMMMHKFMLGATLRQLYGEELPRKLPQLMKELDIDEPKDDVLLLVKRRVRLCFLFLAHPFLSLFIILLGGQNICNCFICCCVG